MDSNRATSSGLPLSGQPPHGRGVWMLIFVWAVAFGVAMMLDRAVAMGVRDRGISLAVEGKWFAEVLKAPGTFWFTIGIAVIAMVLQALSPIEALFLVMAVISSGSNVVVKWIVGRTRPFKMAGDNGPYPFKLEPFWHGIHGLFSEKNLSFPSGHGCTAFALTTAVYLLRPKWAGAFFLLAVLVSAERVLENAHYLSDTVGAAGIGAVGVVIVHRLMRRWLSESKPVQA